MKLVKMQIKTNELKRKGANLITFMNLYIKCKGNTVKMTYVNET